MTSKAKRWFRGRALTDTAQIADYLQARIAWRRTEVFTVLFLDAKSKLIRAEEMFYGGRASVRIHVPEVARAAYRRKARSIIVSHNHPDGSPAPSESDIRFTKRLRLAAAIAGVPLLDHIIVTDSATYSMAEQGPWDALSEEFAELINGPALEARR